ncbi:MAG: branched-chain amino acid ABC transporter permease [Clostridiales bacterium]|nr:branched-chain amino acid ABC transporter permease [Clostridiales bacterium]
MRKWIALILTFAIVQVLVYLNVINDYLQATIATICINIILAVSLNLVTGFTGQFSLGHAGFMSIGAYVCAIILMRVPTVWGFLVGLFAGAIIAAIIGFLVGLPTLRLKGDYLAIATLGMSEIIRIIFLNMDSLTNGAAGLSGIPRFTNWLFLYLFVVGSILLITRFLNSSHGRACISIREDEIAAEAVGINTTKYKVTAFTIGAFIAGIAGALYASYFYFLKPDTFGFQKSIDILVIVVLGGLGSISGSVLAAILLALINTLLQDFSEVRMIIYPLLLIIIMIFRPQGLMGSKELSLKTFHRLGNLLPTKKGGK